MVGTRLKCENYPLRLTEEQRVGVRSTIAMLGAFRVRELHNALDTDMDTSLVNKNFDLF